jgi:hypothetical protein
MISSIMYPGVERQPNEAKRNTTGLRPDRAVKDGAYLPHGHSLTEASNASELEWGSKRWDGRGMTEEGKNMMRGQTGRATTKGDETAAIRIRWLWTAKGAPRCENRSLTLLMESWRDEADRVKKLPGAAKRFQYLLSSRV